MFRGIGSGLMLLVDITPSFSLASSIIICHNHPSGNREPSEADKRITSKIKDAASFFDISLLDHLIVTQDGYYSFADSGEL